MKKSPLTLIVFAVALIGAFFVFKAAFKPKPVENPFSRESRAHLPFEEFVRALSSITDFERKLRAAAGSTTDPSALGFEISQNGLRRLDNAQLDRRMDLVVKLVEHMDVATCAALSRADPGPARKLAPKLLRALEHLSSDDIRAFFDLTVKSVEAELNGTPAPAYSKAGAERALMRLVRKFSAEEQALLVRGSTYPMTASDESACWMVKTVFAEIMDLPAADRQALSRMFVMPADQRQ